MLKISSFKIPKNRDELEYKFFNVPEDMKESIKVIDACSFAMTNDTASFGELKEEENDNQYKDYLLLDFSPLFNKEVKIWVEPKNLLFYGLDKTLSKFYTLKDASNNTNSTNSKILNLSNNTNNLYNKKIKLNEMLDDFQAGKDVFTTNNDTKLPSCSLKKEYNTIKFNGIASEFKTTFDYIYFYLNKTEDLIFGNNCLSAYVTHNSNPCVAYLFKNVKSVLWDNYSYNNHINNIITSFIEQTKNNQKIVNSNGFNNYISLYFQKKPFKDLEFVIASYYFKKFKNVSYINFNFLIDNTTFFENSLYFDLNGDKIIKLKENEFLFDSEYTNARDIFNSILYKEQKKNVLDSIIKYNKLDDEMQEEFVSMIVSFLKLNFEVPMNLFEKCKTLNDYEIINFVDELNKKFNNKTFNLDESLLKYYHKDVEYALPFKSVHLKEKIKTRNVQKNNIVKYLYTSISNNFNFNYTDLITNCLKNKVNLSSNILNAIIGLPSCLINYLKEDNLKTNSIVKDKISLYLQDNKQNIKFICFDKTGNFLLETTVYTEIFSNDCDIVILLEDDINQYLIKFIEFNII